VATTQVQINQRKIKLTNLNKILWPDDGLKKYNLIKYYTEIAPFLLPYLKNRPLVIQRFPDGIHREGFYQKNCPDSAPHWISTHPILNHENQTVRYLVAKDLETLVWLGNQAAIELHPWLSSIGSLDYPDFAVFDLDPSKGSSFGQVRKTAMEIHEVLREIKLDSYPKTSGATGLQIYVPLKAIYNYATVRNFVLSACQEVNHRLPKITTLERKISQRQEKVYLDYLQNVRGKTIVSIYSPRPLRHAPVSIPLEWSEVNASSVVPQDYTINNALDRVKAKTDSFKEVLQNKQLLPKKGW